MAANENLLVALDMRSITLEQAAVLASSEVTLGFAQRRRLGEALLTNLEEELLEHRVRRESHKYPTEDELATALRVYRKDVAEALVGFVASGEDIRWLAEALAYCTDLHIDATEEIPGETYESVGGTRTRRRRLNRSDLASLVALRLKEQRDELAWCRENEEAQPLNWSPESRMPPSHLACKTDQELHAVQLEETAADAARCLSELTPFRLWSLYQHCQEQVMEVLQDHLLDLCLGDGDEAGSEMAHIASRHFHAALDEWEKGE
jgi:hypothetical protein